MKPAQTLIFPDVDALSRAGALIFARAAGEAIEARGRFLVAISGGETPLEMYRILGNSPYKEYLPWEKIHIFWVDERYVPADDEGSNYCNARRAWFIFVPVPEGNVHRIPTELEEEKALTAYEGILNSFSEVGEVMPRMDLVLLGLGSDGHTASLFPGEEERWGSQAVILAEQPGSGRFSRRISMTPALINKAHQVIFLVSGSAKRRALAVVRAGGADAESLPASRIQPEDGLLLWMVDRAATEEGE